MIMREKYYPGSDSEQGYLIRTLRHADAKFWIKSYGGGFGIEAEIVPEGSIAVATIRWVREQKLLKITGNDRKRFSTPVEAGRVLSLLNQKLSRIK
jgi:hypothetical protein